MQSQIEWSQIQWPWGTLISLIIEVIIVLLAERCLTSRGCLVARWLTASALRESEGRSETTRLLESLE